ncbi:ribonuclease J [Paenibacillus sacheonensis]|uniref:Ribonuclease J n=1 Tax=Paenibacillus sacheonensis TaxID=742054 RepID=A0A7X5C162_9BACL|nr:ribonuclease J [Paenibacillus sacheonensis]MBM7564552.1 ribonuclease J [Paenibacillus sacheonensis]NBC69109.1 RNase J family beta-CASP ribonuclease [Paenibacillus sacheonensis]
MSPKTDRLSIAALGGVHEIGKNMYIVQYNEDIIVIDCGSKFPDESLPGIDVIIPDIAYLLENQKQVKGLIVTHGHEDHIGAIPYVIKQLNMPVYATRLTLGLIRAKLKEHGLLGSTKLHEIDSNTTLALGAMSVRFFSTNHSIPDCLGVVFHTPQGVVVHTGDFKFDLTPVNAQYADIHKMAEIGQNGVLALLSESTNAERPGFTPSERSVGEHILEAFQKADKKIFLATFASNVHRVQQVIDAAEKTDRKLVLLGRSMVNVVDIASSLGYLRLPEGMLVEPSDCNRYSPNELVILCTGSQGEPMAALARLASGNHRQIRVDPGDTVILAASPIPGNERNVGQIVNNLFERRAKVVYGSGNVTGMHVSGHASQEELKLMLALMKPKYFIPIHGEYRMLHQHRLLAEAVGVESDNIFIVNNGDVVDITGSAARQDRKIPSGNTLVDGLGIGDVGQIVLRDRKVLSEDGIVILVVSIAKSDAKIVSGPDVISRGFVYVRESEGLMEEVQRIAVSTITKLQEANSNQWGEYKQALRDALGKFLFTHTKRRPMIIPIIIQV